MRPGTLSRRPRRKCTFFFSHAGGWAASADGQPRPRQAGTSRLDSKKPAKNEILKNHEVDWLYHTASD
jgi:hypothetical protein